MIIKVQNCFVGTISPFFGQFGGKDISLNAPRSPRAVVSAAHIPVIVRHRIDKH